MGGGITIAVMPTLEVGDQPSWRAPSIASCTKLALSLRLWRACLAIAVPAWAADFGVYGSSMKDGGYRYIDLVSIASDNIENVLASSSQVQAVDLPSHEIRIGL